jgi:hypothetical protein
LVKDGNTLAPLTSDMTERAIRTGIGPVMVKVPKVRSRDDKPVEFRSALVPPYVRKSASLEAALLWLYMKGISTGEMAPALKVLVEAQAKGCAQCVIEAGSGESGPGAHAIAKRKLAKNGSEPCGGALSPPNSHRRSDEESPAIAS